MIDRSLVLALGASLAAHGAALGLGDWSWPGRTPPSPPPALSASLRPLVAVTVSDAPVVEAAEVAAALPPPPRRKPRPAAPALSAPPAAAPVAVAEEAATDAEGADEAALDGTAEAADHSLAALDALPVAEAGAALAEPAFMPVAAKKGGEAVQIDGWPAQGAITFRVMLGKGGLQVGEARHEWSHDAARYAMKVTLETTGVAALLRGFHYVQTSEGTVGPEGLRPTLFTVAQRGKEKEAAVFDWTAARVSIRRGERERRSAALQPGDQDVLSLWHQIGIVGTAGLPRRLTVVSNKAAEPASLEAAGEERIRLPIGVLDTVKLHARADNGKLAIDIWLARRYGMLPVRIRMVDDKGEVLDQQATELKLAPPGKPARPAQRAELGEEGAEGGAQEPAPVAAAGGGDAAFDVADAAGGMIELKEQVEVFPMADFYRN